MTRMLAAYLLAGSAFVGAYALKEFTWWEKPPEATAKIDPSLRKSPGGWRTYAFWHRGLRGGK